MIKILLLTFILVGCGAEEFIDDSGLLEESKETEKVVKEETEEPQETSLENSEFTLLDFMTSYQDYDVFFTDASASLVDFDITIEVESTNTLLNFTREFDRRSVVKGEKVVRDYEGEVWSVLNADTNWELTFYELEGVLYLYLFDHNEEKDFLISREL